MTKTIAVVGAGALGIYYGGRMGCAGFDVRFLVRGDAAQLREDGLKFSYAGTTQAYRPEVVATRAEDVGEVDLVIIALKATANGELERLLPPLLGPKTAVVTLQNGLGVDEAVAAVAGGERTLGALCFVAVNRTGPGVAACSVEGYVELGEYAGGATERTREVGRVFEAAGVKTKVSESLLAARWRKLVWNVPFNGLSVALGGVTSDETLREPVNEARVWALVNEVQAVAKAEGVEIEEAFIRDQVERTRGMRYKPSTMLDWLAGRPLETESIWGEPLRRARIHGVATPELARLYADIMQRAKEGPGGC
jgi:2-dehydropantoate 2-reductase